jgi:hypothetical protein
VGGEGFEPNPKTPSQTLTADSGGSNSGNEGVGFPAPIATERPGDPDLAAVIRAWFELPRAVRTGIVAMVKAYPL